MTQISVQRRRSGWDIVWGVLLVIGGIIILGDVVVATAVTVLFIGWVLLITGVIGLVSSLFLIGKGGAFWSALLSGALMTAFGVLVLRNPHVAALTITLMAGLMFLVGGLVRLVAGFERSSARWVLLISGLASIILGLIVLFNPVQSTLTLIGILLGIQLLVDGVTLIMFGRVHVKTTAAEPVTT